MASRKKTSFISFEELMLKSSKYFIERGGGEEKVNKRREEGREGVREGRGGEREGREGEEREEGGGRRERQRGMGGRKEEERGGEGRKGADL